MEDREPAARQIRRLIVAALVLSGLVGCARFGSAQEAPPALASGESPAALPSTVNREPRLTRPLRNARIVVHKGRRTLELFSGESLVRSYPVGLGFAPTGDKAVEGDGRTPEGEFYIFVKNPKSSYYLSLGVSYPNVEDAARGLRDGLISKREHDAIVAAHRAKRMPPQQTALGGLIYIHGHGSASDWTLGCVALENADMKELYDAVEPGTLVTILP